MGCFNVFSSFGTSALTKSAQLKVMQRGRNDEQKEVIKYFLSEGGCLSSFSSFKDKDFDKVLSDYVQSLDIRSMALNKLCLDASQVSEINPIFLDGYYFNKGEFDAGKILVKTGKDDLTRCSSYKLSCLLFSSEQLYLYSYKFSLVNLETIEETAEFFYRDIDSIEVDTSVEESLLTGKGCLGFLNFRYITNSFLSLYITVPGNKFVCSLRPENEQSIIGMKNLIRDKKK